MKKAITNHLNKNHRKLVKIGAKKKFRLIFSLKYRRTRSLFLFLKINNFEFLIKN